MAKTNWQDPKTDEIISPHISGLQGAVGKLEESIGMESVAETDIPLSEVFISNDDRCRIYQAPKGKRNWLLSPTPTIKKNGEIITDDFEVEYGGGSVVFTTPILETDTLTADATYTAPIKNKQLSTEDFTTLEKEALAQLESNIEITKSPIGFPNRTDSIFSFDKSTRTFTIEPTAESYEVFFKENIFIKDGPESVVIPNTTGLYYIYFNQDGILSASTNFPGLQNMIYISYIYWNNNQENHSLQFAPGDERHGTVMDKATHERLHAIDWTQWVRGLQLYGYEMNDSSSNDAPKVSITDGVVADEDLFHNISHSPTPSTFFEQVLQDFALLPVMYRQGANGEWRQDEATEYPFKNIDLGRVNFNEFDTEWKQSQVPNNGFVAYYIVFSADVEQPIKVIQGQRTDATLADAQANNDDRDISWGNIPFQEFKVLYRLILQTSDSFTNDRKAMLVDVLDLRTARRSPGGGGIIPSAHSNLTGLDYESSGHTGFASMLQLNEMATGVTEHKLDYASFITDNPDAKNSIYRGKYLGGSVTPAQYTAISSGTFTDMYIGDYWTIGGINWRIAAFNYYRNTGDALLPGNHITIVPDTQLYTHAMNDTNITTGGYVGSKMYVSGLQQAKTTIDSAFSGHVITHRQYLTNAVTNGKASGGAWFDSTVEIMNEIMVYGNGVFSPVSDGVTIPTNYTVNKTQLPLFALNPKMINTRQNIWLRDVISGTDFAYVASGGTAHYTSASHAIGVRPAFSIS